MVPHPSRYNPALMSAAGLPTIGVDLRALVPEATGIGVYTLSLLRALMERGEARFLGLAHKAPLTASELAAIGVPWEAAWAPLGVLWQQLRLPKRLSAGDIDLFWSPLSILPAYCPVPAVVTVHDLTVWLFPETHTVKVRASQLPFIGRTLARADRIIAISEATARDLARYFPDCAPRVKVIYNGVDEVFTPGREEEIAATRRELGCPEGYILYSGTLEPRKNLGLLLDAWEILRQRGTALPLLLAGPYGWGSEGLLKRLEALAPLGVRHLGRLDRPRQVRVMQAASAFAYPSRYEGFGLPPAEAMACGVPTVVSESSSLPEVVGEAGLQVAIDDAPGLAEALGRLLRDPIFARELGRAGLERSRRFRWRQTAAETAALFAELLAR